MKVADFVEKYAVERKNTDSVKWDGMKDSFGTNDLLPMWIADTEFKAPEAVMYALKKRIEHGAYGYSLTPDSYYETYFKWQQERYGTELHREWIRFGSGVVQSISALVNVLTLQDDVVMVLQPVYHPFMHVIENNERKLVVSNLKNDNGHYEMDFDDIRAKIQNEHVKLLINCSPHNPVGRVWTSEELEKLFEICREEKVLVISDEIHHDLIIGDNKFVSAISIKDGFYRDNIVMLDAASKTFNLAALQSSHVVIANPQIRERYDEYVEKMCLPSGNLLGEVAAEAAYREGADWLSGMLGLIKYNFDYVKNQFAENEPTIKIAELEGTYLAWVDMRAAVAPSKLHHFMQHDAKLAVNYGEMFGAAGNGFIRLNLATTPENVEKAVNYILKALKN
ncbi:MalY/PatB family protein [Liquorilactobacillus mali]|uniref:cysteine-S-conjugate beta-lyase n=1 Tax=Liquorilactobacillus mali KCTC 3596 = DSM 20444 TaxID=1046596 RepID=A0A0R2DXU9_9LACO|nr:MalY/PatB family protein [Liquorilactobacillus mali]KRN08719.1 aminotransferase [Liquorilactobacillus mali KCTC 3596 = DSM 20444]MDC7953329.1 pyridoxal phosphate-dependent aminotransferase [Liquorilactobacillus mali]QFQ75453.1 pyridoxal phosphate-dependent aminotransferase [Liquorilactobacillus mali]